MEANSELQRYTMLASFFLPEGILDWFDVVRMEETDKDKPAHELDVLYPKVLHIYLDVSVQFSHPFSRDADKQGHLAMLQNQTGLKF